VESVIADYECKEVGVDERVLNPEEVLGSEINIYVSGCREEVSKLFELSNLTSYGLVSDVVISNGFGGINYRNLYTISLNVLESKVIPIMRGYSLKTFKSGVEYMLIILKSGRALMLEGDVDRIRVPKVESVLTIHTHRRGCLPSPQDIKSTIEVLFDGGLGTAVTSLECYSVILRVGPFTEDDYITINELSGRLGKEVGKSVITLPMRKSLSSNLILVISY